MARKRKRAVPRLTADEVVARAEKKLRQAEFFVGSLAELAQPAVREHAKFAEPMEFHMSASLSAARSAFYILRDFGGPAFRRAQKAWRRSHGADMDFHQRMIDLRDEDVHWGRVDAKSVQTWVDARTVRGVTVISSPGVFVEQTNPDGSVVRAPALSSIPTLYITHAGKDIEATIACRQFISLLRDLLVEFQRVTGVTP